MAIHGHPLLRGLGEEIFENLPSPTLIVDADVAVLHANKAARAVLGLDEGTVPLLLRRGGELLHCIHSFGEGGCGRQQVCQDCVIRDAVGKAFQHGLVQRHHTTLNLRSGTEVTEASFLISTSPIDNGGETQVILTLEDVTDFDHLKREVGLKEQALRESQVRPRQVFQSMAEAFALHEILVDDTGKPCDYRFLDINPAFESLTGLSRSRVLGRRVTEAIPGLDPYWIRTYGEVALTGVPIRFDRFEPTLGRHFEVLAFRTAPGEFATLFLDITERKRMEEAVAVSEERLRNLIRSIPIPLAVNDRDGKIVSVNDKYTAVLGYSPQDVPDVETWFEKAYPSPEYRRLVEEVWGAAIREAEATGGEVPGQDYRVTAKDGSEHTMEISGVPVGDNFLVTLIDVTERDRAQIAVRESEEKYRTLVDSLHAGVVVHAPDTSITLSNSTASELLGLSPEQMRGRVAIDPAWRFVRGDGTPMPSSEYPVNQVLSTQRAVTNLTLGIDRPVTNDRVWVLVNAYPTFRSPGHLQQVVVTFVDITGEKKAEAEQTKLQAKLVLASRLAAMGTLVAGVAHEINNPLAVQLSGQGIALELARDARMRRKQGKRLALEKEIHLLDGVIEALEDAQEGGQRVARIVKDMAAFASPDPRRARVRISDIVANAMRWLPTSVAMVATVNVESDDAPDVVASAGQIEQVVVNLVTNAAKATPAGERGDITIRTSTGTHGMSRLEVIDHGTGIAPAILDRIFEPFFTTRQLGEGRGTGLGLAVCHAIVTAHGGTLTVESVVGKGSTFRVDLPAAPAEA